jgi:DNA invertase Pin-like site-specific DNA recombinase
VIKVNFTYLLESFEKGGTLLCTELSRISREFFESIYIISEFHKSNTYIIFITQPELSNKDIRSIDKIMLALQSYHSEAEREKISERTKAGLVRAVNEGKILGYPKGKPRNSVFNKDKAKLRRWIKSDMGYTKMLKKLGYGSYSGLISFLKKEKMYVKKPRNFKIKVDKNIENP